MFSFVQKIRNHIYQNRSYDFEKAGFFKFEEYAIEELINKGFADELSQSIDIKVFKKGIKENFEMLIVDSDYAVTLVLLAFNSAVYKKTHFKSEEKSNSQKINMENYLKDISDVTKGYEQMDLKALSKIGNYESFQLDKLDYYKRFYNSDFYVIKNVSVKDGYMLYEQKQSDPKLYKVNEYVYNHYEERWMPQIKVLDKGKVEYTGEIRGYWMHDSYYTDRESKDLKEFFEISINDQAYLYLYGEHWLEKGKNNFVIFYNKKNKNLGNLTVEEIVSDDDFEKKYVSNDLLINNYFSDFLRRNSNQLLNNSEIGRIVVSEILRECLSLKDREELDFTMSGPLNDAEVEYIKVIIY